MSDYKRFRVKSAVKSFRDLEVYQKTVDLSARLTVFSVPAKYAKKAARSCEKLIASSRHVPKLIAESYGDKFPDIKLSLAKLESAMRLIADIVTEIDVLRSVCAEDKKTKETLDDLLAHYQRQRNKILNLQRAWGRVFLKKPDQTA